MKVFKISVKVSLFLLLILGTALVETTDRSKFVEAVIAEYDLISSVRTRVYNDFSGDYRIGTMVRIDVFGNFPTAYFDYGFVQITSNSTAYDSGLLNLSIAEDGVNYFAFWDTSGLSRANDYVVSAMLADKSGRETADSDTIIALSCDPIFKNILVSVTDVSFPGLGLSTNLVRSFHIRSGYDGVFGYGWTHSYNVRLIKYPDGSVRVHEGDGSNSWFQVTPSGGYTSPIYTGYSLLPISPTGGFERKYRNGLIERFDSSGKLESITDPNGNSMTFAYDGWLLARIIDPTNHITYLGYNSEGRISSITDPAGRMTLYDYDVFGNLISVTSPTGGVTRYAYDSNHNLVNTTDAEDRCMYFEYDTNDRLASEYYEGGKNKLAYLYDENEPSVTVEDALGHQTTYIYGENNELLGITDALGSTYCFHYNTDYNLVRFVDANEHETRFTYDDRGNILTSRDALGSVTSFTYDERFSKITSVTDGLGRKTAFNYDDRGNLRQTTYPDGSAEIYGYDELGNLINKTNRKGQTISYSYDANGWLVKKVYPDLSDVFFAYDSRGNLVRAVDDSGEISYDYDMLDRTTRVSYPGNNIIEYRYDATGKRAQMVCPDGSIIKYSYNGIGQLVSITDSHDQLISSYTYDDVGRRIRRDLGNGAYAVYVYSEAFRLTGLTNYSPVSGIISSFGYTYDEAGNILTMSTQDGVYRYQYDPKNQLIGVTCPNGSTTAYEYDAVGNRITVIQDGIATYYEVNELDQYISVAGTRYEYDESGNLIKDGKNLYQYDSENRLISVTNEQATISYTYDFIGRRASRRTSFGATNYIYDVDHVILENDETGSAIARHAYGLLPDEILQTDKEGIGCYFTQDGLGSVVDVINGLGNVIEAFIYGAYGCPETLSATGNSYMFTGRPFEEETGLYYYRARYYAPELGRFISVDVFGLTEGINRYHYTYNNPISSIDPSGHLPLVLWGAVLGIMGYWSLPTPPTVWGTIAAGLGGLFAGPTPLAVTTGQFFGTFVDFLVERIPEAVGPGPFGHQEYNIRQSDPSFVQISARSQPLSSLSSIDQQKLISKIIIPHPDSLVKGSVPVFGLAAGKEFLQYRLEYGEGENPMKWILLANSRKPQKSLQNPCYTTSSDLTIFGNLGNWDTGLRNYVYMPSYPADHPVDLNGVYTLRLVVIGRNGEIAEDRATVEVASVISNAFGGTALSRDQKVILTVPEQSIMDSFRLISIKPTEKTTAPIDPSHKLIGNIYEFREPSEKFTKPATLQMKWPKEDLQGFTPRNLGIYAYNPETKNWENLPTERIEEENTLITTIGQITPQTAYYAILASNSPTEGSTIHKPPPAKPKPGENIQDPYLFFNTFENGLDEWSNRDREVGATLTLDNTATPDGTYCLKLANKKRGGNFASNICQTPFDVRKYPSVRFDYKIPSDVKINFLVKVSGTWYDIQFTDDPKEYKYQRVNMAGIGKIGGAIADNNWHRAEFNLYEMLRTGTRNHIVEEMIMADWDIVGYMKLEFGHNYQGATYYIDNFSISKDPQANTTDNNPVMIIDEFNSKENVNLLKGNTFTFSDTQGLGRIQKLYYNEQPFQKLDKEGYSLHLSYDVSQQNAYAGYITMLNNIDLTEYQTLTFWMKGKQGKETLLIGLRDQLGHESKLLVDSYLLQDITTDWQKVTIPLTAFTNIQDWKAIENLNLCFESWIGSGEGEIYIDNFQFEKNLEAIVVDDFEGKNEKNLLGGCTGAFLEGNCTIDVAYDTFNTCDISSTVYRISYGGAIGDLFTYCGWASELKGINVPTTGTISFHIKGAEGGETPNIYLDDGTNRACVIIEKYVPVNTNWQEVTISLSEFSNQGVDLTHLEEFQIVFEWEKMSGTIWIDNIQFNP